MLKGLICKIKRKTDQDMVKALYLAFKRSNYKKWRGPQSMYQEEILKVQKIKNKYKDPTLCERPPAVSVRYVFT